MSRTYTVNFPLDRMKDEYQLLHRACTGEAGQLSGQQCVESGFAEFPQSICKMSHKLALMLGEHMHHEKSRLLGPKPHRLILLRILQPSRAR